MLSHCTNDTIIAVEATASYICCTIYHRSMPGYTAAVAVESSKYLPPWPILFAVITVSLQQLRHCWIPSWGRHFQPWQTFRKTRESRQEPLPPSYMFILCPSSLLCPLEAIWVFIFPLASMHTQFYDVNATVSSRLYDRTQANVTPELCWYWGKILCVWKLVFMIAPDAASGKVNCDCYGRC